MSESRKLNVVLVLLATISQGFTREPVCSKFSYEEKLLEKMIRQEIKVEAMEIEIKKTLNSITTFMDRMEQKMDNQVVAMNDEIQSNLDIVKQRMERFADNLMNAKNELQLLDGVANVVPTVAFHVYNVKDPDVGTKGQVFKFTTILLNEGNGYDSSTGIFTASVAGLYYFTAHVCSKPGKHVLYAITIDDQVVTASAEWDKDHYSCSSVSTVSVLKTGSTVSVQSTYSSSNNILYEQSTYRRISFSGALIHQ